jgi:hypothetical protein
VSFLRAAFEEYEESLGQVKLGQEVRIHLLAYPDLTLMGKVTLIEPNLDPVSRTVKVWIRTDNPQNLLKPDMFAHIGIILRRNDSAPRYRMIESTPDFLMKAQKAINYIVDDLPECCRSGFSETLIPYL